MVYMLTLILRTEFDVHTTTVLRLSNHNFRSALSTIKAVINLAHKMRHNLIAIKKHQVCPWNKIPPKGNSLTLPQFTHI